MQVSDYLLDAAQEHWHDILMVYRHFDFRNEMNARSQRSLKDQYEKAVQENKIVVFVRDNERKKLVSFSMNVE